MEVPIKMRGDEGKRILASCLHFTAREGRLTKYHVTLVHILSLCRSIWFISLNFKRLMRGQYFLTLPRTNIYVYVVLVVPIVHL